VRGQRSTANAISRLIEPVGDGAADGVEGRSELVAVRGDALHLGVVALQIARVDRAG
jgi:hypothetical protein